MEILRLENVYNDKNSKEASFLYQIFKSGKIENRSYSIKLNKYVFFQEGDSLILVWHEDFDKEGVISCINSVTMDWKDYFSCKGNTISFIQNKTKK